MTDQTPITASPQPPDQELALLRAQLQALAELTLSAPGEAASTSATAQEVALLLKDLLEALLPSLQAPSDAPTVAPPPAAVPVTPDLARVEAAMARLLQDLVQETSRRIRAESEAIRAQALLRNHGFQDRAAADRVPLAPRR